MRAWLGGLGYQGLGCLGGQAGFGVVAEKQETGNGREPRHCLAGDPSGEPVNHSIGNREEPSERPAQAWTARRPGSYLIRVAQRDIHA